MENSENNKSSYRSIFKATSLFGGVQFFQIIISLVKSKIIAILLGADGVGINGLFTSATNLVNQVTSMGLSSSAVRNVSEAYGTGNRDRVNRVVTTLRYLVWGTGILGMLAVLILSPVLSNTSFGDNAHIIGFCLISVTLLFDQLAAGQKVLLQGTRKLKYLAKSSVLGALIGLLVCTPLYYFWGANGIVPNIIISSITSYALFWYFARKVQYEKKQMTFLEVRNEGRSMLVMGVAMSLTHILASGTSYILRGYIRMLGGIAMVGLFTAGYQLMNQYTGLVFQAMITDFYPRLSAVNNDNKKCCELVNQQGEIGLLIISPLLCICTIFIPFVVRLLFTEEFLTITDYVVWVALGVFFKMASWSIGYILLAKAESKLFMITEVFFNLSMLVLNIIGFKVYGLTGLGISTAIGYLLYLILMFILAYKRYGFRFTKSFLELFLMQFTLTLLCISCIYVLPVLYKYIIGSILILTSGYISFKGLNNRIDIKSLLKNKSK